MHEREAAIQKVLHINTFIEEQLNKWSRPSFGIHSQVGLSQEMENVLAHILKEGEDER